jgi:hypothetical protein
MRRSSVRFDASGDSLSRTTNLPPTNLLTILGWFKVTASSASNQAFFSIGLTTGDYHEILALPSMALESWSNGGGAFSGTTLTVGRWYHIAATINGTSAGSFLTYLNGKLDITGDAGSILNQKLFIGNTSDGEWMNGNAASVEIYDRALSAGEIKARYLSSMPPKDRALNSYFPIVPGPARAFDASGYGRHLTNNGTLTDEAGPPLTAPMSRRVIGKRPGAAYSQAAAGTLTGSGALTKQARKIVASTLTGSGALVRQIAKVVAGTLTGLGSLSRQANKALTGTLTGSGALVKQANKLLAGALTGSGALAAIRTILKAIDGTLSGSGTLLKQTNKPLAGTLTGSGSLVKQIGKIAAGTLSGSGSLIKQARKSLSGTLTGSGALVSIRTFLKSVGGTLTGSGALLRQTNKTLGGTLTGSGSLIKQAQRSVAGVLSGSGDLTKQAQKILAGTLESAGSLIKRIGKAIGGVLGGSGLLASIKSSAQALLRPKARATYRPFAAPTVTRASTEPTIRAPSAEPTIYRPEEE